MRMTTRMSSLLLLLAVADPLTTLAQEAPSFELTGSLSYARLTHTNWTGWNISGNKTMSPVLGIAFDMVKAYHSENVKLSEIQSYTSNDRVLMFMAGPRITSRGPRRLIPYANLLLGVAHGSSEIVNIFNGQASPHRDSATNVCMLLGGGIDYQWRGPLSVRIIQIDYLGARVPSTVTFSPWIKGWKFSAGLTLHLGKVIY